MTDSRRAGRAVVAVFAITAVIGFAVAALAIGGWWAFNEIIRPGYL